MREGLEFIFDSYRCVYSAHCKNMKKKIRLISIEKGIVKYTKEQEKEKNTKWLPIQYGQLRFLPYVNVVGTL